jgi:hypothetical protein
MPSLDHFQTVERLEKRLQQLEGGEALEARDIKALLNDAQVAELEALWTEQQAIRKSHKTQAKAEADGLIWKTIRDVRIEVYKKAIADAKGNNLEALIEEQHASEVRGARIFLDSYFEATASDKDGHTAGNNALRRAHLQRMDGVDMSYRNERDREVQEMDDDLRERIKQNMSAEELKQLEIMEEHEKNLRKPHKR